MHLAKRVAFYQTVSPDPTLFPENVYAGLMVYATMNADVDLLMELALNEKAVREHTTLGKRIKSLDTGETADPVAAIKEVVSARKETMTRRGKDVSALETNLRELQAELDRTKRKFETHKRTAKREYGSKNTLVTRSDYDRIIARRKADTAN